MKRCRSKIFSPLFFSNFFALNTSILKYFCPQIFENHKICIFFIDTRKRQIYKGDISFIYQPILINLGIKLIVLMRGIQWNKLQSNISINKNFRFLPLLCELCSKKVKKRKNWPSESKKKLHHDFFQIFSHINSSDRTLHLTTTRPSLD